MSTNTSPDLCPQCGEVTADVNLTVNVSTRFKVDGLEYTGDTYCGDTMASIGTSCLDCGLEWIRPEWVTDALESLGLLQFLETANDNPKEEVK